MRVLALVPSIAGSAPGQRFRIEQWLPHLEAAGIEIDLLPFEDEGLNHTLYQRGQYAKKAQLVLAALRRRMRAVLDASRYDCVLVYREAAMIGPAILERRIAARGIPIVYDFDDPIWMSYRSPSNGLLSLLKWSGKTKSICGLATTTVVGNRLLASWARPYAKQVEVVPSTVELHDYQARNGASSNRVPRLGWTGSHSTLPFLNEFVPVLREIAHSREFELAVISHTDRPALDPVGVPILGLQWRAATEGSDLSAFDIGLGPFPNHGWTPWRCHGKILQYMASGIPVVASDIGIMSDYISDGDNGFLATSAEEWIEKLRLLIDDRDLRVRMGAAARQTIAEHYTAEQWGPRYAAILKSAYQPRLAKHTVKPRTAPANLDVAVVHDFGEEWSRFDQGGMPTTDYAAIFDMYFGIFPFDRLPANARGADIGCGSGRWAREMARRVGHLHCVDAAADALAVAQRNLADRTNCELHHADLASMPFDDASLDFAYCLGVLHHVPDTLAGLRSCVRKLKPGAPLLLYVYYALEDRPLLYRLIWKIADATRAVVSRLPSRLRHMTTDLIATSVYWPLARVAALLQHAGVSPHNVPLALYKDRSFYVMRTDALDRFGTRLEKRFTRCELQDLMRAAGLIDITFSEGAPYWVAIGYREKLAAP